LAPDKITVVNNTIAVEDLKNEILKWDGRKLEKIKNELNIKTNNIGIFVGGMYKEKRLDFLLKSLEKVREEINDFEMIFIGDGPEKDVIIDFSKKNDWVHYFGEKNGLEKVPYFLISKLFLMPGLVGLAIIDTFVFRVPLITTDCKIHSPEIHYLENEINGVMTENDLCVYSNAIISMLQNEVKREKLKKNCIIASEKYTMQKMVDNFFNGICNALNYN